MIQNKASMRGGGEEKHKISKKFHAKRKCEWHMCSLYQGIPPNHRSFDINMVWFMVVNDDDINIDIDIDVDTDIDDDIDIHVDSDTDIDVGGDNDINSDRGTDGDNDISLL